MEERKGRYTPEKMLRFINACAALHNICLKFKIELTNDLVAPPQDEDEIACTNLGFNDSNTDCQSAALNFVQVFVVFASIYQFYFFVKHKMILF